MRFNPAKAATSSKPVAVILSAGPGHVRIVSDDGALTEHSCPSTPRERDRDICYRILAELKGWQIYALCPLSTAILSCGADRWTGQQWRHALSKVTLDAGPDIHPLRRPFEGVPAHDAAGGVFAALDWLWDLGVAPGSVSSMAGALWRRTLPRPLDLWAPDGARHALYGGRQEAPLPQDYTRAELWDLSAAYPTSMAAEGYPRRMVEIDGPTTAYRDRTVGWSQAEVTIPPSQWGPLPVRLVEATAKAPTSTVCYLTDTGGRRIVGWWSWRELAMAEDHGCEVTIRRSAAPLGSLDLFGPWWSTVAPGRALAGPEARLAKAVTSSLWGRFAMSDARSKIVRWCDPLGRRWVSVGRGANVPNKWAAYIATETTARVRERLYREALIPLGTAVYCDTDGVIAGVGDGAPTHPGWRVKDTMRTVQIRAPQMYRWTCEGCDFGDHAPWHYVVAGAATPGAAEQVFRSSTRKHAAPSIGIEETTLPSMTLDHALSVVPPAETVLA